jgi:hypothetical protein
MNTRNPQRISQRGDIQKCKENAKYVYSHTFRSAGRGAKDGKKMRIWFPAKTQKRKEIAKCSFSQRRKNGKKMRIWFLADAETQRKCEIWFLARKPQ